MQVPSMLMVTCCLPLWISLAWGREMQISHRKIIPNLKVFLACRLRTKTLLIIPFRKCISVRRGF